MTKKAVIKKIGVFALRDLGHKHRRQKHGVRQEKNPVLGKSRMIARYKERHGGPPMTTLPLDYFCKNYKKRK